MAQPIELRVHGVGGTPAADLLGVTGPPEITRVAGAGADAFYARVGEPSVEGYAWGPLTSGRPSQILWVLLLPFTMVNLGGWMLPAPQQARAPWVWKLSRLLIALLGLGMTATYALGSYSVVVRRVFVENRYGPDSASLRLISGSVLLLVLLAGFYFVSRNRQKEFEGHTVPVYTDPQGNPIDIDTGSFLSSSNLNMFQSLVDDDDTLQSPAFWAHDKPANQMLNLHALFAALILAGLYLVSAAAIRPGGTGINLEPYFIWLGFSEIGILAALVLLSFGFRNWVDNFAKGRFRVLGLVVAPTIGFVMSSGLFTMLALGAERCFPPDKLATKGPVQAVKQIAAHCSKGDWGANTAGPNLGLAFQWALVGFLIAVVLLLIQLIWGTVRAWSGCPPISPTAPGLEPNGLSSWTKRLNCAIGRSSSEAGKNGDLVFTLTAVFFAVSAVVVMSNALKPTNNLGETRPTLAAGTAAQDLTDTATKSAGIFGFLALAGPWVTTRFFDTIRGGHRKPATRRKVGIVWDVLGFWPRRFHPFAVRPYAERAVPELLGRVGYHVTLKDRCLLLSTHSQGTVLGFAAVARICASDRESLADHAAPPGDAPERFGRRVAFLTYGCPLSQLHGRFFPGYFNTAAFNQVTSGLMQGTVAYRGKDRPVSWRNFFRQTDYIGKKVRVGNPDSASASPTDEDTRNQVVDDPSIDPLMSGLSTDAPWDSYPDPMRTPWLDLARHSYYNDEKALKDWIAAIKAFMT